MQGQELNSVILVGPALYDSGISSVATNSRGCLGLWALLLCQGTGSGMSHGGTVGQCHNLRGCPQAAGLMEENAGGGSGECSAFFLADISLNAHLKFADWIFKLTFFLLYIFLWNIEDINDRCQVFWNLAKPYFFGIISSDWSPRFH